MAARKVAALKVKKHKRKGTGKYRLKNDVDDFLERGILQYTIAKIVDTFLVEKNQVYSTYSFLSLLPLKKSLIYDQNFHCSRISNEMFQKSVGQ